MGNIGFIGIIFYIIFLGLMFVLPLVALIDIFKSRFKDNEQAIFVLIVIMAPIIGPALYFIVGTKRKI